MSAALSPITESAAVAAAASGLLQDAASDAASCGDIPRLKELITSGARIGVKDREGFTLLHRATVSGSSEAVTYLLSQGADPNPVDKFGETPLHYAAQCGFYDIAKALLAVPSCSITIQSADGLTPLAVALHFRHHAVANIIMAKAAEAGASSTVQGDEPASVPASGSAQYASLVSYLSEATFAGDVRKISTLISQGADVNGIDLEGYTPLHKAASIPHIHAIELLLNYGADPNARDPLGCTPLHYAALSGATAAVHSLLAGGADMTRRSKEGVTALELAKAENCQAVVAQLTATRDKVAGYDLSWGVALEGEVQVRKKSSFSLFKWKSRYLVLSMQYGKLFLWNGSGSKIESAVVVVDLADMISIEQESRTFEIKLTTRDPIEIAAANPEDAAVWVAAIRAVATQRPEKEARALHYEEIIQQESSPAYREAVIGFTPGLGADHSPAAATTLQNSPLRKPDLTPSAVAENHVDASKLNGSVAQKRAIPTESLRSAPVSITNSAVSVTAATVVNGTTALQKTASKTGSPSVSALRAKAILTLQRVYRGYRSRKVTKGWVRITDEDGDIYWYNVVTEQSSWVPPGYEGSSE